MQKNLKLLKSLLVVVLLTTVFECFNCCSWVEAALKTTSNMPSIGVDLEAFRNSHLYPYKKISQQDAQDYGILNYCCNQDKLDKIQPGNWYSDGFNAPVFQWSGHQWIRLYGLVYKEDFVGTFDNETRTICFDHNLNCYLFEKIETVSSVEELAQKPLSCVLVVIADANGTCDKENVYRVVRIPRLPGQRLETPRAIGLELMSALVRNEDGLAGIKP